MKACVLVLLSTAIVLASDDDPQLAMALKAQTDFARVELAPRPGIPETQACIQSQAAALAVSPPEERSLLYFRKGLCTFAGAVVTRSSVQFRAAVAAFDQAIDSWPARLRKNAKHVSPEPVAPALLAFDAIARLNADPDGAETGRARGQISAALETPSCDSNLTSPLFCGELIAAGTQWLGWIALHDDQVDAAVRHFTAAPGSGWNNWVLGRRDFDQARYSTAATQYGAAIDQWKLIWQGEGPTLVRALSPRPQFSTALADWGAARLLAGDVPGAIVSLDASLKAQPANSHALFLRARAKELAGNKDAALADYNLASRTALAAAQDLASGDAHLYRGIVFYRQKDFAHAEEEFSNALNFEMTKSLRSDARAWRQLAAVAGGSCGSARQSLDQALATVSPFFPQDEARSLTSACSTV
jgi:hypothetical protein